MLQQLLIGAAAVLAAAPAMAWDDSRLVRGAERGPDVAAAVRDGAPGCEILKQEATQEHPAYASSKVACASGALYWVAIFPTGSFVVQPISLDPKSREEMARREKEEAEEKARMAADEEAAKRVRAERERFAALSFAAQFRELARTYPPDPVRRDNDQRDVGPLFGSLARVIDSTEYECRFAAAVRPAYKSLFGDALAVYCNGPWFTVSLDSEGDIRVSPGRLD